MIEVYDLRRLPEDGETIDEALPREWLDAELGAEAESEDTRLRARADGRAELHLERLELDDPRGPVIQVSGALEAALVTACVRCLEDVPIDVAAQVSWTLFPETPPRPDPEAEPKRRGGKSKKKPEPEPIELEAQDETTYKDGVIELPALVRESILLEVDMNPCCADEPACAARTAALLAKVNPPEEAAPADPRWAALADLRSKLS